MDADSGRLVAPSPDCCPFHLVLDEEGRYVLARITNRQNRRRTRRTRAMAYRLANFIAYYGTVTDALAVGDFLEQLYLPLLSQPP